MSVKFQMTFMNAQETECTVKFYVDDSIYSDAPITIYGGGRPFVLQEFNNDKDLFRPIRSQQATIEILASASGVTIDDFLVADDDKAMKVIFTYGSYGEYWYGIVSQDDISENWIAQNHIITIRADDGFGSLKTVQLQDFDGNALVGQHTPYNLLQYAMQNTARATTFWNVISNLFYTGMSTAVRQTGLDQCLIDVNTFESDPETFDDAYTVIEKINSAWNQTVFQYRGEWWILRIPELFIPQSDSLAGFQANKPNLGQRANTLTRFMANVGVNELVKPIMPEMLRSLNKPSKNTIVSFEYDPVEALVCNQSFQKGAFSSEITVGSVINFIYDVDDWDHRLDFPGPTIFPSTKEFKRYVLLGQGIEDAYVKVEVEDGTVDSYIQSCQTRVSANYLLKLNYLQKWADLESGVVGNQEKVLSIILESDGGPVYGLTNAGTWDTYGPSNTHIWITRTVTNKDDVEYIKKEIEATIPYPGLLTVRLIIDNAVGQYYKQIKDLNVEIIPPIDILRFRQVTGSYVQWTIAANLNKSSEYQIYLDNGYDGYKGTIYLSDGATKTQNVWFNRNLPAYLYDFKEQNSRSRLFFNRRYRTILEANFFGLEWTTGGNKRPIGLINTIKFVDDDPDKTFAIVNLREIDFLNCTWSADLVEIWDEDVDTNILPSVTDIKKIDVYFKS